jgi:CheY-like chemotaxis protein
VAARVPLRGFSDAQKIAPTGIDRRHMPEIDGFGLVERIHQEPSFDNVRIVALTSGGLRGEGARCPKLRVAAYLSKPFDRLELA